MFDIFPGWSVIIISFPLKSSCCGFGYCDNRLLAFNHHFLLALACGKSSHPDFIWVRSWSCGCLVTWFCYHVIAKPGSKTAAPSWHDHIYLIKFSTIITVNFLPIPHNRHPIAHPWGKDMGFLFQYKLLIYVLFQSLLCCMRYNVLSHAQYWFSLLIG